MTDNVHAVGRLTEVDRGYEAQKAAEAHLEAVWDAEEDFEEALTTDGLDADLPESPAVGPWDGCTTCTVREVLYAGWPYAEQAVLDALAAQAKRWVDGGYWQTADVIHRAMAELKADGVGLNGRSSASPEPAPELEVKPRPFAVIDGDHGHEGMD